MMENKKNLEVTAAICDVRFASEETLAAYDRVSISCATLIANPEIRALLARHQVEISAVNTMDMAENVKLNTVNGSMFLTPSQTPTEEKTFLILNGMMDIAPGCEEVLKSYAGIQVNGSVAIPESMTGLLTGVTVNGEVNAYPDNCIRLNRTTVLERTFPLRAKQDALYYAASRIIALDGNIDFGKLAEKNVRFAAKRLLIAEGLAEAALPLFDEKTDINILPDGCVYLGDDTTLDERLIRRYGGKLYVDGDLILLEDGPWLEQVSYLRVGGDVLVAGDLEDRLNAMDVTYEHLYVVGGTLLMSRPNAHLTRALLEDARRGLSIVSCADVRVDEDVPVELLREKLVSIVACAKVVCTEEQRAVIEPLAQDVASIGPKEEKKNDTQAKDSNTVKVAGAYYTL